MNTRPLGILLATNPARGDQHLALRVARAAAAAEREIELFAMGPGVLGLAEILDELADCGARILACSTSVADHALEFDGRLVEESSQDDHAALVERCSPLLSLS